MIKHSFSDFSYAVNIDSAKKGQKEVLVCFIYNGVEVLKKVYIPEKAGTAYILEAKKIIDQEMRDGTLAIYSHKFINRNKRKKIQPKKVVAAAAKGEKIAPIATPADPSPKGNKKWVIATVVVAAIAVACAATAIVFATKGGSEPPTPPTPTVDKYVVSFDTRGGSSVTAQQVEGGKTATEPEKPIKKGWEFDNWEDIEGNKWDFANKITSNITLYAHWKDGSNIHTVTFNYNDGTGKVGEAKVRNGQRLAAPDVPIYAGHKFDGWYNQETGGSQFKFDHEFDENDPITSDLFAHWTEDVPTKYDVVFHLPDEITTAEGTETSVDADKQYSCNFNIEITHNFKNIEIYMGSRKLAQPDDYTFTKSGSLSITAPAKGIIHITLTAVDKREEPISDYFWEPIQEGSTDVIVTGIKLPEGILESDILSVDLKKTFSVNNATYNVVGFRKGILKGFSSIQNLTIPFVGLSETPAPSLEGNHLLGALFGDETFKGAETLTYQDYYEIPEGSTTEQHYLLKAAIPSSLNKVIVTDADSIPLGSFSNCSHIQDVTIDSLGDEGIIGRSAFHGCRGLKNFVCDDAKKIEDTAFDGCLTLANFDFSKLSYIGTNAFRDCLNLTNIYLSQTICEGDGVIKTGAFENFEGLIKCYADSQPENWEDYWCGSTSAVVYGLKDPTITPTTDSTNKYSCLLVGDSQTNSQSVYIIQYLGDVTTENVTVPDTLTFGFGEYPVSHIGSQAFMDFIYTKTINMSACKSLVSIGSYAFAKCYALETVSFSSECNLTTIGTGAFAACSKLVINDSTSATFPSTVEAVGNSAFKSCSSIVNVNFSGVKSVGDSAFEGCSKLTKVKLYSNQTMLGEKSFMNCESLTTISYTNNAETYSNDAVAGIIPDYCYYNTSLKSITVPTGIKTIGNYAYALCSKVTTITINSTTLTEVGSNAFLRCIAATGTITLPTTLETIGSSAFQDCYRLTGINCKSSKITEIPDSVCYGDSQLDYFVYGKGAKIESIGDYAFAQAQTFSYLGESTSGTHKSDNKMSPELGYIGVRAFINCVGLGSYYIWNSGTSSKPQRSYTEYPSLHIQYQAGVSPDKFTMGEQAFYGCYGDGWATPEAAGTAYAIMNNVLTVDKGWINYDSAGTTPKSTKWGWQLQKDTSYETHWYYEDVTWGAPLFVTING